MWLLYLSLATAFAWKEKGPSGKPTGRDVDVKDIFFPQEQSEWNNMTMTTKPTDLAYVARYALQSIKTVGQPDTAARTAGLFAEYGVTLDDVRRTLMFIVRIADEDRGKKVQRLQSPAFIRKHFTVYRWHHDAAGAKKRGQKIPSDQIRMTKYLVFSVKGSPVRTAEFNTALYSVPTIEAEGGDSSIRMKYTRMDVYAGVFEAGGAAAGQAKPLVYLTRDGANQALMQGTIEVDTGDGNPKLFNVHKNNGRAYNPRIKDQNQQGRFWYFRDAGGIFGVGDIALKPQAAVAGDIYNIGVGKIVALEHHGKIRLTVLADTGGAFQPNLFQLDYLAGKFPNKASFAEGTKHLPTRTRASILILKK